ncbi:LOW QUALITY PROTEIN: deubiquitinating protein VCPIP1-like [Ptychodera flava]|uniref:LOW QUALITY PROTEIN: deubiquitinating protein VCPIP1-like n=1 Tax=Ptychodera flava TaxID=63121 RepID=UPI00396A646A
MLSRSKSREPYRVLSGFCPDEQCKTKLFFPAWDTSIECTGCGQRHEKSTIKNVEQVTDPEIALHNMVRNVLLGNVVPKKGTDSVRFLGLSNYQCKLLGPLLTTYGMDKAGKAQPLRSLNQGDIFDCSILGDRAFQINREHINIVGYGRDQTGSVKYLQDTIETIHRINNYSEELLIPLHADGDGHCLVHAVSRALVGRELFWHALRVNLHRHFQNYLDRYQALFSDFIDTDEWSTIIDECDPEFIPSDGEALGLRNIHIFGLANVLHRPIILLDSLSGLSSLADYSGVFLPALIPVEKCRGKDGKLNKPICIAWSSPGRNHYIPLVGVKGAPLPRIPRWMLAKAWGMPPEHINQYVEFDLDDVCTIGGDRTLGDKYIQRLANAMEEVFVEKHEVHPALVADMHQYVYKRSGIVGVLPEEVIEAAQKAVNDGRLYRCLTCDAISEFNISPDWFGRGGMLYNLAENTHGKLQHNKKYSFPVHGLICSYDPVKDELVPDMKSSGFSQCTWCQGNSVRVVKGDGSVVYINGDRTKTPAPDTRCNCGFKHYWDGKEYDNLPESLPVELSWSGRTVKETCYWFQYESDPSMNSNAFEIASNMVQKHFPGEFGSERLVHSVADSILKMTARKEEDYKPITLAGMQAPERPFTPEAGASRGPTSPRRSDSSSGPTSPRRSLASPGPTSPRSPMEQSPTKMILTGLKSKTFHKEELTLSEKEKEIKERVESHAALQQRRATLEEEKRKQREDWKKKQDQESKKDPLSPKHADSKKGTAGGAETARKCKTTAQPQRPSGKKIRLSTSDGRQLMMSLETAITYKELQMKIEQELLVPAERQKLKYGFPPRDLKAPEEGKDDEPVPLQHGDKVMIEILPDPNEPKEQPMDTQQEESYDPSRQGRQAWSGETSTAHQDLSSTSSELMQGMENLAQEQGNVGMENLAQEQGADLDLQISSMALMATLTGTDLWGYVQKMPHLFTKSGLFYRQVERDLGLADNKHFTLPTLPNKTFRYNASAERIELCLEPLGHFAIAPGVDDPANLSKLASEKISAVVGGDDGNTAQQPVESSSRRLAAGASGVINPGMSREKSSRVAFTGQAHTLSGNTVGATHGTDASVTQSSGSAIGSAPSDETMGGNGLELGAQGGDKEPVKSESVEMSDSEKQQIETDPLEDDNGNRLETDVKVEEIDQNDLGDKAETEDMMDIEPTTPISPMLTDSSGPNLLATSSAMENDTEVSSSLHTAAAACDMSESDAPALVRTDTQPFTVTTDVVNESCESDKTEGNLVAKKVGPGYTILTRESTEDIKETDKTKDCKLESEKMDDS